MCSDSLLEQLAANGQIATQYVDFAGMPSMDVAHNPNGSCMAIEGILSPDGRVFGKMGHSERIGTHIAKNIIGEKDQPWKAMVISRKQSELSHSETDDGQSG